METFVKVYRWDEVKARSKPPVSLDLVYEGKLEHEDAPGPDHQRRAVQVAVGLRWGKRIRGCSALTSGGFAINIDPEVAYP